MIDNQSPDPNEMTEIDYLKSVIKEIGDLHPRSSHWGPWIARQALKGQYSVGDWKRYDGWG